MAKQPTRRRAAPGSANLISFATGARFRGVVGSPESRKEMEPRLRIREARAEQARREKLDRLEHEHWKERMIVRVGIAALGVIGLYCLVLNAWPGQSPEARAWASSTLTGIVGGLVGYILGSAKK